jgi:hypothetical protein
VHKHAVTKTNPITNSGSCEMVQNTRLQFGHYRRTAQREQRLLELRMRELLPLGNTGT